MLGERVESFVLAPELVRQLAEGMVTVVFELTHELAHLAQLSCHRRELLVDQALLPVELGRGAHAFLLELRPARLEEACDQLVAVRRSGRVRLREPGASPFRRHEHRRGRGREDATGEHAEDQCDDHAGDPREGV